MNENLDPNTLRIVAIDPGSTVGYAIGEIDAYSFKWRVCRVGNTSGIRGIYSILDAAVAASPTVGGVPGVILLEAFHIRDVRAAATAASMTTLEAWGAVRTWGATHLQPGLIDEYYKVISSEPPSSILVHHWRQRLGRNPGGDQADHPYVATAHIEVYLRKMLPLYVLDTIDQSEVWLSTTERSAREKLRARVNSSTS